MTCTREVRHGSDPLYLVQPHPVAVHHKSIGGTMHVRCALYVERITQETQEQYQRNQASLRWQEEDRL